MSNEYKDWLWDIVTDAILEQELVDYIYRVQNIKTGFRITGFKTDQIVAYIASQDDNGQWQFEATTPDIAPDEFELGYVEGWRHGHNADKEVIQKLLYRLEIMQNDLELSRAELNHVRYQSGF